MAGSDGTMRSTWQVSNSPWQPWFAIAPQQKAAPGARVTALWAPDRPGHLDLFMSGNDGTVWSTWWEGSKLWQKWFAIAPQQKAVPEAKLSALWAPANPGTWISFMTGHDGTVWSTWWAENSTWQNWFRLYHNRRLRQVQQCRP